MNRTQERSVSDGGQTSSVTFRNPPVAETSVGFYFARIEGWNPIHQGALWERYRQRYPELEVFPPVPIGNPESQRPEVQFDFLKFRVRTCFVNSAKTQLVQIQDGIFFHNWRKTPDAPLYQDTKAFAKRF
jgi:uncharacterized protein (TIGR04255 family)